MTESGQGHEIVKGEGFTAMGEPVLMVQVGGAFSAPTGALCGGREKKRPKALPLCGVIDRPGRTPLKVNRFSHRTGTHRRALECG